MVCFVKDCKNKERSDVDCILKNLELMVQANERIITHYKAMKIEMKKLTNENQELKKSKAREACEKDLNNLLKMVREKRNEISKSKKKSSDNSTVTQKKDTENSSRLLTPNKKRKSDEMIDEDLTYCEILEAEKNNAYIYSSDRSDNQCEESGDETQIHSSQENDRSQKEPDVKIKQEKPDNMPKRNAKKLFLCSQSQSQKDSSFNSVIYVEPSQEKIITISETPRYSPPHITENYMDAIRRQIERTEKDVIEPSYDEFVFEPREKYDGECEECEMYYDDVWQHKGFVDDSKDFRECSSQCQGYQARCKKLKKDEPQKQVIYDGECDSCQCQYTRMVQMKGVEEANKAIFSCDENCEGYQKRLEKSKKARDDNSKTKNGVVLLQCNKFARRRKKVESDDATPAGFWDLDQI